MKKAVLHQYILVLFKENGLFATKISVAFDFSKSTKDSVTPDVQIWIKLHKWPWKGRHDGACFKTVKQLDQMVICHKLVLKSVSYPKIVKNTPILIEQSIACNVYTFNI